MTTPTKAILLPLRPDNIPQELRDRPQWVAWQLVHRDGQSKPTKIPKNPKNGNNASSTDPYTWGAFDQALAFHGSGKADGIGFVFSAKDPFTGIDLDKCRDAKIGEIEPWAKKIIQSFDSYHELSPSGSGVHIIVQGKLPLEGRKTGQVEMYDDARFFTVTGHRLPNSPLAIEERQEELTRIHAQTFPEATTEKAAAKQGGVIIDDADLIQKALASRDDDFKRLWQGQWEGRYPSPSEADLALCGKLAFWTGNDISRMDRIFRQSGLYRAKWDQRHYSGGRTYGQGTLTEAISGNTTIYTPIRLTHSPTSQDSYEDLKLSDTWNAHRLVAEHGGDILWCEKFKQWFIFDGTRFACDTTREIERRAEKTVKGMYGYAGTLTENQRRRMAEWAIGSESRHRLTNMVESAKRLVPVDPTEFDRDPTLFNVANGTINLRTQQLLPHNRANRLSKRSAVVFDPAADCRLWTAFLNRIFEGNEDLIEFVQRVFGYCLTGLITEQVIFILYGIGANGKSTLLHILRSLGGDYAYHCRPEVFTAKRNDSQGFELVPLAGARIVTATETSAGRRLDEALVKEMTGGEPINCAPKYGSFFIFQPAFKPLLATNHKPDIRGADEGIWRRVRLIPFTVTIPERERDLDLKTKLESELSGILNWALEGVKAFLQGGLQTPEDVKSATAVYRAEQDVLAKWIEENCLTESEKQDEYAALYQDYCAWCEANHEEPINKARFSSSLDERGFPAHRGAKGKRLRIGISRRVTGDAR
ncbi:MAG: hypothetical protein HYX96_00940 [Chloroflexi bacterium]|nr:hypothetical protein [Chloroflexota bacterium]